MEDTVKSVEKEPKSSASRFGGYVAGTFIALVLVFACIGLTYVVDLILSRVTVVIK